MPATAFQVAPAEPPFAVRETEAPGAIACVWVSDQTPGPAAPSSKVKRTPCFTPAGVGASPWFLTVAENVTALPGAGLAGSQETPVTTRSGFPEGAGVVGVGVGVAAAPETVICSLLTLFASSLSAIRLTSSTWAFTVCVPATAFQVAPAEPPFAVTVTHAPGAIDPVWVSDQTPGPAPPSSNMKRTPCFVPAGVGASPWFLIVARSVTALPGAGLAGSQEISVTTRSGFPDGVGVRVGVGVGVPGEGFPPEYGCTFRRDVSTEPETATGWAAFDRTIPENWTLWPLGHDTAAPSPP